MFAFARFCSFHSCWSQTLRVRFCCRAHLEARCGIGLTKSACVRLLPLAAGRCLACASRMPADRTLRARCSSGRASRKPPSRSVCLPLLVGPRVACSASASAEHRGRALRASAVFAGRLSASRLRCVSRCAPAAYVSRAHPHRARRPPARAPIYAALRPRRRPRAHRATTRIARGSR